MDKLDSKIKIPELELYLKSKKLSTSLFKQVYSKKHYHWKLFRWNRLIFCTGRDEYDREFVVIKDYRFEIMDIIFLNRNIQANIEKIFNPNIFLLREYEPPIIDFSKLK